MKKVFFISILIVIIIPSSLFAKERVSLGFLYGSSDSIELVKRTNGGINEVAPMYLNLTKNGNLSISNLDEEFISEMKKMNIKVTPFLSNHWSRSKGRAAVKNREKLTLQLVECIIKYDLDGINVDIENLTQKDRENFSEFVKLLKERMPKGKSLTVSVAANPYGNTTGWQGSYDYGTIGEYSDYIFLMSYDEHSTGGSCGPVASAKFVEESIQYALRYIDKNKIVMGIPLYGRYWKEGEDYGGDAIVIGDVPRILNKLKGKSVYDEEYQTAKANFYVSGNSKIKVNGEVLEEGNYTVWYENEQSIRYKLYLVNKYNLKGAGVWALGQEKVDVWEYYKEALNEAFKEEPETFLYEGFEDIAYTCEKLNVDIGLEKPLTLFKQTYIDSAKMTVTILMTQPPKKKKYGGKQEKCKN